MPLLFIAIPAGLVALGYATDKVGEGINDTATAALKIAIAGGIAFYIVKKMG